MIDCPTKKVLCEQEVYRTIWRDVYEPIRKVLAGTWLKQPGGLRFELKFDQDGRFWFTCHDLTSQSQGTYTIVALDGTYYIAMNFGEGQPWVLAIDEIHEHRLQLRTAGEPGTLLAFSRRAFAVSLLNVAS